MASHSTLSSQQRANVLKAYRYRGRRDRQLYLTYSVKMDRDCILSSNYRFLHWLLYLEADHNVMTFEICDEASAEKVAVIKGSVDAWVTTRDRHIIGHRILADERAAAERSELSDHACLEVETRIILQSDLRTKSVLAMRYAKIVCFGTALRDQRLESQTMLVTEVARSMSSGTVGQLLREVPSVDDPVAKGLIARLALTGWLSLDVSHRGYTSDTQWQWEGAT
ncbi:hypothetical protein FPJ27_15780 [Burkholderia sp. MS455]|uniref:hypothetical protein n=1 Tax=Burkholderia sp. MS455 TaxID=2811788 RepID=UPI00195A03F0|nr:hypothetical protein [Burkholderia sp. MS455]QRR07710.1 hypothetical protein FPJ27_15780 [Burkholderia sp. MS455]